MDWRYMIKYDKKNNLDAIIERQVYGFVYNDLQNTKTLNHIEYPVTIKFINI